MPDKHEVGGSSPLGPTSRTKQDKNPYKERKRLFSSETRDKLYTVVRVHLGLPLTFFEKKGKQRNFQVRKFQNGE